MEEDRTSRLPVFLKVMYWSLVTTVATAVMGDSLVPFRCKHFTAGQQLFSYAKTMVCSGSHCEARFGRLSQLKITFDRIQKTKHIHQLFVFRIVGLAFQVTGDDALVDRVNQGQLERGGIGA